jgi:hypothetical protein
MVERMIRELGPSGAATALFERLCASPMGAMPEPMIGEIAKRIVDDMSTTKSKSTTKGKRSHG